MASSVLGTVFELALVDSRSGSCTLEITGNKAEALFANESGGHRWQRVPPNDRHGRVHTSTITVAVLHRPSDGEVRVLDRDLEISTCRGSGPGGQHRNMTDSAVQIKHIPTGIMVRCEAERAQSQNKQTALSILRAKIWQLHRDKEVANYAADRKSQIGSGMRGDKRRTIRQQDGVVVDHLTGQKWEWRKYSRGDW